MIAGTSWEHVDRPLRREPAEKGQNDDAIDAMGDIAMWWRWKASAFEFVEVGPGSGLLTY